MEQKNERTLEVVMSWGDSPEQVEHFEHPKSVVVGSGSDVDFALPESLAPESFNLIESVDDEWILCIPFESVATASQGQEALDLSGMTSGPGGVRRLRLTDELSATVSFGDISFFVRTAEAEASVAERGATDWSAAIFIGGSAFAHAIVLGLFMLTPPSAAALNMEDANRDELLRMQFRLEAYAREEQEIPEPDPTPSPSGGAEGQSMQGEEGASGSTEETRRDRGRVAVRGSDAESVVPKTAEQMESQLQTLSGIRSALANISAISSPYGADTALGASDLDAWGPRDAAELGMGAGLGGFGLHGTGRGGCPAGSPNCGLGTVGVGNDLGIGVGSGGNCDRDEFTRRAASMGRAAALESCTAGGSGTGRGRPGRHNDRTSRVPRITASAATVNGGLSKETIRRVVRRNLSQVKHCYEQQLRVRPDLEGRVAIRFVVQRTGGVAAATIGNSSLGDRTAEQCIARKVRTWSFPASDGVTSVTYPFRLHAN